MLKVQAYNIHFRFLRLTFFFQVQALIFSQKKLKNTFLNFLKIKMLFYKQIPVNSLVNYDLDPLLERFKKFLGNKISAQQLLLLLTCMSYCVHWWYQPRLI